MTRLISQRTLITMLALLAGIGSIAATPAPVANSTQSQLRKWPNSAFNVGEKLTFDIRFGFITAGHAVMSIPAMRYVNGRKTYETRVEASSTSGFDWVFKVRDRYETYMDVDGIFPWRFEQHVREGNYAKDYNAFFDPDAMTAESSDGKTYKVPQYVHDIVSAFYYVRTLDMTHTRKGDIVHLQNFFDGETHPLDVRVLGHQQIETDAGTFNCVVIEPMVVQGGLFKSEGSIKIWLTDDDNHMPVRMASKILIGEIVAELTKYEGLRNALLAKVG